MDKIDSFMTWLAALKSKETKAIRIERTGLKRPAEERHAAKAQ